MPKLKGQSSIRISRESLLAIFQEWFDRNCYQLGPQTVAEVRAVPGRNSLEDVLAGEKQADYQFEVFLEEPQPEPPRKLPTVAQIDEALAVMAKQPEPGR